MINDFSGIDINKVKRNDNIVWVNITFPTKHICSNKVTDEVIITVVQIMHIRERHPNDYELFSTYFDEIIRDPDYIIEAKKPNTALILKEIKDVKEVFKMVLRLITSKDNLDYKNSIITFMKIDDKEWNRLLRNKKILYKKTQNQA